MLAWCKMRNPAHNFIPVCVHSKNKLLVTVRSFRERKCVLRVQTLRSAQSCLTLCDPLDGSPPGFSVHGIFQA